MPKEITTYLCNICDKSHTTLSAAVLCEKSHKKLTSLKIEAIDGFKQNEMPDTITLTGNINGKPYKARYSQIATTYIVEPIVLPIP